MKTSYINAVDNLHITDYVVTYQLFWCDKYCLGHCITCSKCFCLAGVGHELSVWAHYCHAYLLGEQH